MSRTLKVYNGEDQTPIYDITDMVEWPECEFGNRAHMGESTLSNLRFRDEDGRVGNSSGLPAGLTPFALNAHNVVIWQESGVTLGRMRISPKDWTRGAQVAGRAREAEVTLEDYNSDLRNIVVHNYARPAETDKARVQGVLASYLSGSPRRTTNLNGSNYVSSSNLVTLPATTYDRTNVAEVLASIASTANKLYFVTVDGELFYDGNDSTAYQTSFKISDRDTDLSSTVFAPQPGGFGPASSEDGQQLLSGLWLFYGESQYVHVTSPTVANQYSWWEDVVYDDTVTTAAAATTLANALLAQRSVEDRQIAVRIGPLTYGQAIQIKAGQLIQIKWRAIPDADDAYVSRRITELRWSTPEPFAFFADMMLDRPIRLHGQGQKIDAVIPKGAPECTPDTVTGATPVWSWTWTTNDNDDGTNTYDGGLDRTVPGGFGDYAPANAAFGAAYGRNNGSAYASQKVPISASTDYSFRMDILYRYTPANRDTTLLWYSAADALLRTDTWVDGSGHATNTKYHEVATFTSPVGAAFVQIDYTNFAGVYADNVFIETPGSVVAADNDPYCIVDPGESPYFVRTDEFDRLEDQIAALEAGASALDWFIVTDPDYGAVGDGTTDDTLAIQAAIDAAEAVGGVVYFPNGTYKITAALTVNPPDAGQSVRLIGAVATGSPTNETYGSIIKQATADTTAISSGANCYDLYVENLKIMSATGFTAGYGITATRNVHCTNVWIYGFWRGYGLLGTSGVQSYYSKNYKLQTYAATNAGVYLEAGVNNIAFFGCRSSSNATGVFVGGVNALQWIGGAVENNTTYGIRVDSAGTDTSGTLQESHSILIEGVYFENNGTADIRLGHNSASSVRQVRIANCRFEAGSTDHITGQYVDGVIIENNYFELGLDEISFVSPATNVTLIGKQFGAGSPTLPAASISLDPADTRTPVAVGVANAAGSGPAVAYYDHVHDASSAGGGGHILISDTHSTPLIFGDLLQTEAGDDLLYSDT